jgi:hypothetical protein
MLNQRIFGVLGFALFSFATALAQTAGMVAQPGAVVIEPPTMTAIGIEWRIQGDINRNASVALAWRRTNETAWREGMPLLRLQGEAVQQGASFHYVAPNMFAGSVFGLDPPGLTTSAFVFSIQTRRPARRPSNASSAHVRGRFLNRLRAAPCTTFIRGISGTKLEPNFISLMAAYNTGANGADFVNS